MAKFDITTIATEEHSTDPKNIVNGDGTSKIAYLDTLRDASRAVVNDLAYQLGEALGLLSDISEKRPAAAIDKCIRPSTLERYPWFELCHLRDYLRFRTHLATTDDFVSVMQTFVAGQASGLLSIVKIDVAKLRKPGMFGWRMVATDIRVKKTGMLVEHYMTFSDLIQTNEQWLHKVYEKWRSAETDSLSAVELRSLDRDARFSRHAYRELLFDGILAKVSATDEHAKARNDLADDIVGRLAI